MTLIAERAGSADVSPRRRPAATTARAIDVVVAVVVSAVSVAALAAYARVALDPEAVAERARANAVTLQEMERLTGLAVVTDLGAGGSPVGSLRSAAAAFYALGYWPFVVGVVVVAVIRRWDVLGRLVLAIATSGLAGVVVMTLWPLAPPRLVGFDDAVASSGWQPIAHPDAFLNPYAAMPSFHVAWSILAAAAIGATVRTRRGRLAAAVQPVIMVAAVIVTANHWASDVVVGAALAAAAWCWSSPLARAVARARAKDGHGSIPSPERGSSTGTDRPTRAMPESCGDVHERTVSEGPKLSDPLFRVRVWDRGSWTRRRRWRSIS